MKWKTSNDKRKNVLYACKLTRNFFFQTVRLLWLIGVVAVAFSVTAAAGRQRFEDVDWIEVMETGFRKAPEIFAKLRVII
jgi:hypothetical protein